MKLGDVSLVTCLAGEIVSSISGVGLSPTSDSMFPVRGIEASIEKRAYEKMAKSG